MRAARPTKDQQDHINAVVVQFANALDEMERAVRAEVKRSLGDEFDFAFEYQVGVVSGVTKIDRKRITMARDERDNLSVVDIMDDDADGPKIVA